MINSKGQEVLDTKPVELPIGYKHPLPLDVRMKMLIKDELSKAADQEGWETWEEANDFEVGEDDDKNFPDEDDQHAVNDPFLERAFNEEKEKLSKKQLKAKEETKTEVAKEEKAL